MLDVHLTNNFQPLAFVLGGILIATAWVLTEWLLPDKPALPRPAPSETLKETNVPSGPTIQQLYDAMIAALALVKADSDKLTADRKTASDAVAAFLSAITPPPPS